MSYCYITIYHKFSGLEHLFIIAQFRSSEDQAQLVLCSGFHMTKIKVLASVHFFLEVLGMNLCFRSFSFMAEFNFLQLHD